MSWPDAEPAPVHPPRRGGKTGARLAGIAGIAGLLLLLGGAATVVFVLVSQVHAPQPGRAAAGTVGASVRGARGPSLSRSVPVSVDIPAIGVHSELLRLGVNTDGTIAVPPLTTSADEAAWYKYSATPGQIGAAVIEGHVDSYHGPAVFFRLGALRPGDTIDVTLADRITAIFRVTGVREYSKTEFPSRMIYGTADYAALRLITCGGAFDSGTGHYLSSTVVFASLTAHRRELPRQRPGCRACRLGKRHALGLVVYLAGCAASRARSPACPDCGFRPLRAVRGCCWPIPGSAGYRRICGARGSCRGTARNRRGRRHPAPSHPPDTLQGYPGRAATMIMGRRDRRRSPLAHDHERTRVRPPPARLRYADERVYTGPDTPWIAATAAAGRGRADNPAA